MKNCCVNNNESPMTLFVNSEEDIKRAVKSFDMCKFINDFREFMESEFTRLEVEYKEMGDPMFDSQASVEKVKNKAIYNYLDKLCDKYDDMLYERGIVMEDLWL